MTLAGLTAIRPFRAPWHVRLGWLALFVYLAGYLVRRQSEVRERFIGFMKPMAVLFVVAVVRSAQPTVDLLEGLVNGWARVLTTELPVAGRMDLLVAPLVVIGLATVVGVVALLRSRSAWLPMAPLLVIVALGLAFGDGAASQPWAVVAGLVGGSCALALLRSSLPRRRRSGWRCRSSRGALRSREIGRAHV